MLHSGSCQKIWFLIKSLTLRVVTSKKLFNLFVPQFPHMKNEILTSQDLLNEVIQC